MLGLSKGWRRIKDWAIDTPWHASLVPDSGAHAQKKRRETHNISHHDSVMEIIRLECVSFCVFAFLRRQVGGVGIDLCI
jgi:hypothetical protein